MHFRITIQLICSSCSRVQLLLHDEAVQYILSHQYTLSLEHNDSALYFCPHTRCQQHLHLLTTPVAGEGRPN